MSFPDLPPNFFAKKLIFFIATIIGNPLTVDVATRNQMRPSCANIQVEVELVAKLSQRARINEEDITFEIKYKWVKVQYDYMPKYCSEFFLQGHDKNTYWTIHQELFDKQKEAEQTVKTQINLVANQKRVLTSGKIVRNKHNN